MQHSPRSLSKLSEPVHHQLNMYAIAASAAGVSLLALTQPAEAKIVYTHTNQVIQPFQTVYIDLNHDGISDFAISAYASGHNGSGHRTYFSDMTVAGLEQANAVVVKAKGFAAALHAGKLIGRGEKFKAGNFLMDRCFSKSAFSTSHPVHSFLGPWVRLSRGYLGLKFTINGKIHYGWARLTNTTCSGGTLTGYAYETIPDKPIIAGKTKGTEDIGTEEQAALSSAPARKPASLGALALGSPGTSIWRREESLAAAE